MHCWRESGRLLLIVLRKVTFDCIREEQTNLMERCYPKGINWHHISESVELSRSSVLLPCSPTLKCKQSEVLG